MLFIGVLVMVLGTYANLYAIEEIHINPTENIEIIPKENLVLSNENKMEVHKVVTAINSLQDMNKKYPENQLNSKPYENIKTPKEIRHEPPQPEEPQENIVSAKNPINNEVKPEKVDRKEAAVNGHDKQGPVVEPVLPESENEENKVIVEKPKKQELLENENKQNLIQTKDLKKKEQKKTEDVDIEAIKKEETELKEQEKSKEDVLKKQLDILKQQNEVQMQIVQQQQQLLEVIKQHQEQASVSEKQKKDLEKVQQKKLEAVKQIENIAKQAIESLAVKDTENKVKKEEQKEDSKTVKKDQKDAVKLIPLPLAVSNNLTIDGKPRHESKEIKQSQQSIKENEFNINQVDNMNINIRQEINVNVDGKKNPKNLIELLKQENQNNKTVVKNNLEKNNEEHQRSERSVGYEKNRSDTDVAKTDFIVNKSASPLAEIVSKLSEVNVVANIKTPGRDLKYFQAKS